LNIYSDSGRTTHVTGSPKTLDLQTQVDFEYVYAVQGRGQAGPQIGGTVENLDLNEVAAGRTTYNTDSHPLGVNSGISFRRSGTRYGKAV
jgi:hypothetical protein